MNSQNQNDLQQQFEAAVARVDNLPGDVAAAEMTELYGLFKQATSGDHDTCGEVVGDDTPDNVNGQIGLSQGQWESWAKFKGVSQDDAKRQYIQLVEQYNGPADQQSSDSVQQASAGQQSANAGLGSTGQGGGAVDSIGQPVSASQTPPTMPGSETLPPGTAKAPFEQQGGVSAGGLQGDINDGAPYGGEDRLKTEQ